jgi:glutamate formiminotransferase
MVIPIFEAVPNISEGRDLEKLEIFAESLRKTDEIKLLDYSADPDHNRSVFTYIGTEAGMKAAAKKLLLLAKELLNIRQHTGIHPRMGVIDVLPIIPVLNTDMTAAVKIAHELGVFFIEELKVPVFYYEYAAKDKKSRNLAKIRAKSYNYQGHETLGSVCIGARDFLVAYNVNLETRELSVAKEIAKRVRESSGGLKYLKALGLYLESKDCAQVSMNLVAPEITTKESAFAAVKKEALALGVQIKEDELIGLLPESVKIEASIFVTELEGKIKNADIKKS